MAREDPGLELRRAIYEALQNFWGTTVAPLIQRLLDDGVGLATADQVAITLDFAPLAQALSNYGVYLPLEAAARFGAGEASYQLGITTQWWKTDPFALQYAKDRAAEMVAMRRVVDPMAPNGYRLVKNPNARWQIADTTRDQLHDLVVETMTTESDGAGGNRPGPSYQDLKYQIEQSPGFGGLFGEYRAEMIARSELAIARNQGAAELFARTKTHYVEVIDNPDCPICGRVAGTVQTVEWAAQNPLGHPHCVRAFAPVDAHREARLRAEGRLP